MFDTYESGGARNRNAPRVGRVTDKYSRYGSRSIVMNSTVPRIKKRDEYLMTYWACVQVVKSNENTSLMKKKMSETTTNYH